MADIRYRVYPTLLNEFAKFLSNPSLENRSALLNRINRVSDFDEQTLMKFRKGTSFEDAVLKDKKSDFDPEIIFRVKEMLPKNFVSQLAVKFNHADVQFYGFADVAGEGRVIDIKTTSSYKENKYKTNFQNLYLYALKDKGFSQMEYIIYDFETIKHEVYSLENYDFSLQLHYMEMFTEFLDENRRFITDKKIFVEPQVGGLFG
ncbi:MAG: hypothetical protein IPH28_10360 [Cytophagaceae bacterium]|nr:hypothetical protein [Cytophagaceae bacterium]